ncbi:MAG TPA: BON domain-containing protein, partial [Terriglobales bacterium]
MKVKNARFRRMAMLVATMALAVACSKPPSDSQVTSNIQTRLAADSGLQNKQVAVQAEKGTVTLSGTVDNDAERQAAAKYAASEPGVKQVINNLQVAPMAAAAETTPAPAPTSATTQATTPMPAPATEPISRSKPSPSERLRRDRTDWRQRRDQPPAPAQSSSSAQAPDGNGNVRSQPDGNMPSQTEPPPQTASAPPPEPRKVTVPSGAEVSVRLIDAIDSATAQAGDNFHATLDAPIAVDGDVVVPAHYDVEGHVVDAHASGKFAGRALLDLQLDRIKVGEKYYNIQT